MENLAGRWEIDCPALVEKLKGLSLAQQLCVIDAVERFWQPGVYDSDESRADRLRRVGFLRKER